MPASFVRAVLKLIQTCMTERNPGDVDACVEKRVQARLNQGAFSSALVEVPPAPPNYVPIACLMIKEIQPQVYQ